MSGKTMTPDDPNWDRFRTRLSDRLELAGGCESDRKQPHAVATLRELGDYDVPASLAYFRANGGCCCDCEIVWNVGADRRPPPVRRARKNPKPRGGVH